MMRVTRRRLLRMEAATSTKERLRYVWVQDGEPVPEAKPGERLVMVRWAGEADPADPSEASGGEEREGIAASGRQ
jgi:hypothetical protein